MPFFEGFQEIDQKKQQCKICKAKLIEKWRLWIWTEIKKK